MEHLSNVEEKRFRDWYKKWVAWLSEKGQMLNEDPDDPRHQYDYRKAYKLGLEPTWTPEHQQYRWPDTGKEPRYEEKPSSNPGEIMAPQSNGKTVLTEKPDVVIAHGGTCPDGYIFDHNRGSIYYGKCVSVITGKPGAKGTTVLTDKET